MRDTQNKVNTVNINNMLMLAPLLSKRGTIVIQFKIVTKI